MDINALAPYGFNTRVVGGCVNGTIVSTHADGRVITFPNIRTFRIYADTLRLAGLIAAGDTDHAGRLVRCIEHDINHAGEPFIVSDLG